MVKLKLKVGEKGQVLIPKFFREKYGIREGEEITIEPWEEGLLLKGRPSKEEALLLLREHASKIKALDIKGPKLGELKRAFQEMEYEAEKETEDLPTDFLN
jgi:AbrB family looped-hinge helix DNA binding protein